MAGKESGERGGLHSDIRSKLSLTIPYDPPNWNEYIDAERANKYIASNIKRKDKNMVAAFCHGKRYKGKFPCQVTFRPHFANHRKDLDNTRVKGILDGLVACGVLPNDNLKMIQRIVIEPVFDDAEQTDIEIEELR